MEDYYDGKERAYEDRWRSEGRARVAEIRRLLPLVTAHFNANPPPGVVWLTDGSRVRVGWPIAGTPEGESMETLYLLPDGGLVYRLDGPGSRDRPAASRPFVLNAEAPLHTVECRLQISLEGSLNRHLPPPPPQPKKRRWWQS